jgi:hypothetical protein
MSARERVRALPRSPASLGGAPADRAAYPRSGGKQVCAWQTALLNRNRADRVCQSPSSWGHPRRSPSWVHLIARVMDSPPFVDTLVDDLEVAGAGTSLFRPRRAD